MGGNLSIRFKEFLIEGGNVRVGDIAAEQIDMTKIDRKKFVKGLLDSLVKMNSIFEKEYGVKIWQEDKIKSGKIFSGSSEHFVDLSIPDLEFSKFKPTVGDIDTQVDLRLESSMHEFFQKFKKFGELQYIGQSDSAIGQISALFKFRNTSIQIDFEFVEYTKNGPTDFSKFSRSSAWEDIQAGIKGVFHKFAIACIDSIFTKTINLQSGKKKVKVESKDVHFFAFSVMKGLRPKYRLVDEEKNLWEEIPSKEGTYETDISNIFFTLFKKRPNAKDLSNFKSFVGIIDLINKYFTLDQKQKWVDTFAEFIWGKGAQKLYRGNPEKDAEVKHSAMDYIEKKINIKKEKYKSLYTEYYIKY